MIKIEIWAITFWSGGSFWSTMGQLGFIIVSASLVASFKVSSHSFRIFLEFVNPCILTGEKIEMFVHDLFSEFSQSVQSLERVSWWYLLFIILSSSNGNDDSWWKFHFFFVVLDSYRVVDEESTGISHYIRCETTLSAIGWWGFLQRYDYFPKSLAIES